MRSIIINSSLIYFTFTESPNSILFSMLPVIDVGNIEVIFFFFWGECFLVLGFLINVD